MEIQGQKPKKKISFSRMSILCGTITVISIILLIVFEFFGVRFAENFVFLFVCTPLIVGILIGVIGIITEKKIWGFLLNLVLLVLIIGGWMMYSLSVS